MLPSTYHFVCLQLGKVLAIFYPETKGRTLEQMDDLFGKLLSDPERDHTVMTVEEHENGDQGHVEEQTVLGNSKL